MANAFASLHECSHVADQIAALAAMMADQLSADPDTSETSFAVEGLATLAKKLAHDIRRVSGLTD